MAQIYFFRLNCLCGLPFASRFFLMLIFSALSEPKTKKKEQQRVKPPFLMFIDFVVICQIRTQIQQQTNTFAREYYFIMLIYNFSKMKTCIFCITSKYNRCVCVCVWWCVFLSLCLRVTITPRRTYIENICKLTFIKFYNTHAKPNLYK